MQKAPLFTLALLIQISAFAQDTTWFDKSWKETTPEKAQYYRTKTKSDTGWSVKDHYRAGIVQMSGVYADDSFHIQNGEFRWYDDKGVITHLCTYNKGKLSGLEITYYEGGHEQVKGNNKAGERDGQWIGYYPSGKLAGKATYAAGKQLDASLFHEDGSRKKTDSIFQRGADFPGGIPQFTRFLNKTLRYPDSAVVYEIQGTVRVTFKVSKEGKVSDLKVTQSVDKYLDEEALRVLRLMPDWRPAIIAGIPSDSYQIQPIVFSLQVQ